jgi:hypothetical protein
MKLDLIEQPTKNCDVCSAETGPEDAFCQECGVSLFLDLPEPESFATKILLLQNNLLSRLPKIPAIPGLPKLPTAVPAFIALALSAGAVTWCIQRIDTSFDTFSEDYISSAALKAVKKHNTAEAAELLLRFHLEHAGKMTAEHLSMLGQYLNMRADEAIQTRDYSTAINYLKKVPNDCPQYAAAQSELRDLKERGLKDSQQIYHQVETTNVSEIKDGQPLLVVPQVVPQVGQQDQPSAVQESKLQTSIPIWQRFSRGVTTNRSRVNVSSGAGNANSSINGNAANRAGHGSDDGSTWKQGNDNTNGNPGKAEGEVSASNHPIAENERDKPKVSGFFIDGKAVNRDSKSQEPEKSPEKVTEATRSAGPKSRLAVGQKSYNPDDISRYNELLANYFSQHDASSQKSTDKHVGGAEPPSFQEWISKGRPGFR